MIACIIEFGVRPGREDAHQEALAPLLEAVTTIDGFISKETFDSRNTPGRIVTISYWRDREAMQAWMRNKAHVRSIGKGRRDIFSHYSIRIAEVERAYDWSADDRG